MDLSSRTALSLGERLFADNGVRGGHSIEQKMAVEATSKIRFAMALFS